MQSQGDQLSLAGHMLDKADQLRRSGFGEAAVVTAQSACEIACEWAIAQLLERRGVDFLHGCVDDMIGSYNLAGRARELYVTLSGDRVQEQPFWFAFTECVKRRNRIVHRGDQVSSTDAQEHLAVARQLIAHLEQCCTGDSSPMAGPTVAAERTRPSLAPHAPRGQDAVASEA
jgi:hypothetical protein